jgi:hypothetical protein
LRHLEEVGLGRAPSPGVENALLAMLAEKAIHPLKTRLAYHPANGQKRPGLLAKDV